MPTTATLAARTHVSKAQFDLEFELYRELWKQVEALRARAIKIWVPLRKAVVAGSLTSQLLAEAQSAQSTFENDYEGFVQYYLSQSPFIAPSVKTWIDEHQHQSQYSGVHATFADAIRERLASVAIIA